MKRAFWVVVCAVAGCSDPAPTEEVPDQAVPIDQGRMIADMMAVDAVPPADAIVDAAPPDMLVDMAPPAPGDRDGDRVPDDEDAFPDNPSEWSDRDGDGTGDNSDPFPNDPTEWVDNDNDGQGDNGDPDDDNDGIPDEEELIFGADCVIGSPLRADTDGDGINDDVDPYPRDPFAEFLVRTAADGRIELFLSNRDGSFRPGVVIGEALMHEGNPLSYGAFSVGDFDGNGQMDFLAHTSPLVEGQPERDLYLFVRDDKADEFIQRRIGTTTEVIAGVVADVNADFGFDIARFEFDRDGNVSGGRVKVYLNTNRPDAPCVSGPPDAGCFFAQLPVQDISPTVAGQWIARSALQAVNLNPNDDDHIDLVLSTYANGGNAVTTVYSMSGNGDGTFAAPVSRFLHNQNRQQAPANTIMFADFNADGVGDVSLGFDDDGAAGASWTYFGIGDGSFFDMPVQAVDINPGDAREQGGGESLGRSSSGRSFDFDFDGRPDMIVGVNHVAYASDGETRFYRGRGDGTFDPEYTVIGAASRYAHAFALPQQRCVDFSLVRD